MKSVELRFRYTEEEFAAAWRFYAVRRLLRKIDVIISTILLAGGLWMTYFGPRQLGCLVASVALGLLVTNAQAYFVAPRRVFRRDPRFHEEYTIGFSENEISITPSLAASSLTWDRYQYTWDTPQFLFLFFGVDGFTILPKRAFEDVATESAFVRLVESKLGASAIKTFI